MQPTTSTTTTRRTLTVVRRPVRRPFRSYGASSRAAGAPAPDRERPAPANFRTSLADAFRAIGASVDAATAQEHATGFYRAARQDWARALGSTAHDFRRRIATAFRGLGAGVAENVAHEKMVAFYRASGHAWAANLA
jgi:hypothetical protein